MKLNATLSVSAVALLAACGGGSSPVGNNPVEVGQVIQSGPLEITIERVYANGAAVGSFDTGSFWGQTYRSNPADLASDATSALGAVTQSGTRDDVEVTASNADMNRIGTRYRLNLPNNGVAQSQIRRDVSGPHMDLAACGSNVTSMPTGTITYGVGGDDAVFIHANGSTVQLPFTFTADLTAGTATFTATSNTHQISGGVIAIDPLTGRFYGTNAQIGTVGALASANISGGLFGINAEGLGGIIYSKDQAAPSISANFVGSK